MDYELKLEQFSGPIEKLLELIEGEKMAITELSLAKITADFLEYTRKIEKVEPRLVSDFIVIAAQLMLIKSKELLPGMELTREEEQDADELKYRLQKYAEFKPAIALFKNFIANQKVSISRPYLANKTPIFYPPEDLDIKSLESALKNIFESFKQFSLETETIEESLIKLEEKIEEIVKKMESGIKNFSEIAKEKSRTEIIVLFLALLHLLRDQIIKVEQEGGFSDIIIKPSAQDQKEQLDENNII